MFVNRVPGTICESRLDANYYRPECLSVVTTLLNVGSKTLSDWVEKVECGPFGGNAIADDLYEPDGIPFLRPLNLSNFRFNDGDLVRVSVGRLKANNLKIYNGRNLYFGRVGDPSAVTFEGQSSISPNVIVALGDRNKGDIDYVFAFLSTDFGRLQLLRQLKTGVQPTTSTDAIRDLRVWPVASPAQTYIGDKVRQAERLRARARELEGELQSPFDSLAEGLESSKKAWRIESGTIDPYRINPKQYNAVAMSMLKKAAEAYKLIPLGDLIDDRGVSGGATPLGAQYPSEGVFFVRVQNVKPMVLDLSDAAYLSPSQDDELRRSRCQDEDLILSITGYPGTAAVVYDSDLPVNINQHSVRLHTIDGWPTGFVAALINSKFGQIQVDRFAIGGTRDSLDYVCVKNLLIPEFPESLRQGLATKARELHSAKRASERLTTAAKLLVEALIEGQVSESDLVAAQKALEANDRSADRAILQRLTRKGMDAANEPALFPDLDALYDAVDALDGREGVEA